MSKSPAELTIELEELAIKYEEQKLNFADFKGTLIFKITPRNF
jgi:hypothetical protein